ncbi:MAG: universal stress protein [Syntrophobacteraceae bacterium]|nr:universal stress protein [Syntrophobacteraceae bacterium]
METKLFRRIGFCTDFSENADQAFAIAKEMAVKFGAAIEIIHVTVDLTHSPPVHDTYMPVEYNPGFVEEITRMALDSMGEKYVKHLPEGISHYETIVSGYPATEILRLTEEKGIDLLVMGSHGLTGLAHVLFGSTAERIVRRAGCSVLTVRLKKS